MKILLFISILALNFSQVDRLFSQSADYDACKQTLTQMLPQAENQKEKAQVLWRLARVCLMKGETSTDKAFRRETFTEGIGFADQAIAADPSNPDCYMWHSANFGRECQTHSLMEQAKAVPVMMKDMETILDKLGKENYSAAWQALAEIYRYHPMKSKDEGINYARKAALTVPSDELRLSSYILLAEMLYDRNWTAEKRAASASRNAAKYSAGGKGNIAKYAFFDGSPSAQPWNGKTIGAVSDREEARSLLEYASKLYSKAAVLTPVDRQDMKALSALQNKMK